MTVLNEFLVSIAKFLRARDENQLRLFLRVEPPLPEHFIQLGHELRASYRDSDTLESHIHKFIPDTDNEEPGVWPGFLLFLRIYLEYWRDVNFDDLLGTHAQLSSLVT
jgi:nuclear mRNA export protein PCID2/THP1